MAKICFVHASLRKNKFRYITSLGLYIRQEGQKFEDNCYTSVVYLTAQNIMRDSAAPTQTASFVQRNISIRKVFVSYRGCLLLRCYVPKFKLQVYLQIWIIGSQRFLRI